MEISEIKIKEIAEELDSGMCCFLHKQTEEIEVYPDPIQFYDMESEPWDDIIEKIETNRGDYIEFERMDSHRAFQVMEDFADSLTDTHFQKLIEERLSQRKPFQRFKALVEPSEYRQAWFDFKSKAMSEWVKRQIPQ